MFLFIGFQSFCYFGGITLTVCSNSIANNNQEFCGQNPNIIMINTGIYERLVKFEPKNKQFEGKILLSNAGDPGIH